MDIKDMSGDIPAVWNVDAVRVGSDGLHCEVEDLVVCEHFITVYVNGTPVFGLSCTPKDLCELVLGRLLTEGFITGTQDVDSIFICGTGETADVVLPGGIALKEDINVPTCCTGNKGVYSPAKKACKRLSPAEPDDRRIFALVRRFKEDSALHRGTNGTHSCYLDTGEDILCFEDISRHNALDKAVGYALINGIDPAGCILFTTGRIALDMCEKAIMAGIPVLASKAAATREAVNKARECGLTLICKAWPDSFAIEARGQKQEARS